MPSTRTIVSYRPTQDEEGLLEALSQKLGLSKSRTLAFALRRIAAEEKVTPAPITLTAEEQQAIQRLYAELGPEYWKQRNALETRQRAMVLSDAEREELIRLIDQGEEWNVRRLEYLFALAKRYGKPHDFFLETLGLRHHPLSSRSA